MYHSESGDYEAPVNGYANTSDSTVHQRTTSDSDPTKERGYFARLSIEEKARQMNAGSSDYVREAVTGNDSEEPYNSFRRLSMSSNDGQTDARRAAKQMYAEFSYSPHKRSVEKYTPPIASSEGLAPRKRDHEIRVIPKAKQSSSVTQLKGVFDNQPAGQSQQHTSYPSQRNARVRKESENDILESDRRSVTRPWERDREEPTMPEDLATRKARFERAEALFKKERKAPPPPVNLTELINKDKTEDKRSGSLSPVDRPTPLVPPKPAIKRFSGNLERNIDVAAARLRNEQVNDARNERVTSNHDTRRKSSEENDMSTSVSKLVNARDEEQSKERRYSNSIGGVERSGSQTSRAEDNVDRQLPDRYIERKRSGSGGVPDGVDIHEWRRKMPPKRASSIEFQGLEENVEVYGKKPIDINAILGFTSSSEKIEEEKEVIQGKEVSTLQSSEEETTPDTLITSETKNVQPDDDVFIEKDGLHPSKVEPQISYNSKSRSEEYRARKNSLEKRKAFLLGGSLHDKSRSEVQKEIEREENELEEKAALAEKELMNSNESSTEVAGEEEETVIEEILTPTAIEPVKEIAFDFSQLELQGKKSDVNSASEKRLLSGANYDSNEQGTDVGDTNDRDPVAVLNSEHKGTTTVALEKDNNDNIKHKPEGVIDTASLNLSVTEGNVLVDDGEKKLNPVTSEIDFGSSTAAISIQLVDKQLVEAKVMEHSREEEEYEPSGESIEDLSEVLGTREGIRIHRQYSHEPPMDEVSMSQEGRRRSGSYSFGDDKGRNIKDAPMDEEDMEQEQDDSDEEGMELEEYEEGYYHAYPEIIELPPPPERSCLSHFSTKKEKRSVVIQDSPSSVIFTYGPMEYDRGNPEIDPVTASAEWELEKRVDNMDIFSVDLDKDERGLGLSIIGLGVGTESGVEKLGIFVKSLTDGGSAQRDGRIQVKDQILEVNGTSLVGVTQQFAAKTLKETRGSVRFLMGREKSTRHYNFNPEYEDSRQLIKNLEQRHNEEIGELMRRYQEVDERAADAEQTLEAIRIELCEAEERAHKAESDMEDMKNELDFLKSSSVPPVVKMKNEIKKHKAQDTKKTEKIDHLQKLLQEISEKLATSEQRLADLHQENVEKQGQLQSLKEKLEDTEREYQEALQGSDQLSAALEDKSNSISDLQRQLDDYKRQVTEVTAVNGKQKQQLQKLEQEVIVSKATSHENKLRIVTLEKKEADHLQEIKRLRMENDTLTLRADSREEELRKLAEERSELRKKIEDLESGHQKLKSVHSDFASKEEEYKSHIRQLEEKLQSLSDRPSSETTAKEKAHEHEVSGESEIAVGLAASVQSPPSLPNMRDEVNEYVDSEEVNIVESAGKAFAVPEEQFAPSMKADDTEDHAPQSLHEEDEENDGATKEIIVEVHLPAGPDLSGSVEEQAVKGEPEPEVESTPPTHEPALPSKESPPSKRSIETEEKMMEDQGGLIEFQYKPGGPFFPDLSDMPETVVDSPSESDSEEGEALAKDREKKQGSSDREEDPTKMAESAEDEKPTSAPLVENVVETEAPLAENDAETTKAVEKGDETKEKEEVDAPTRAERSSFLESLRENPSFKAWLDEEWNIVSNKIKEDEAEKIAQQVMASSPLLSDRSERENEELLKRSGSATLDESYFKRTLIEQESIDVRPKLLEQDSQEITESTEDGVAEASDSTDSTDFVIVESPEVLNTPEPVSFSVPDTEPLNSTPQLDKLRIARERSHRRPSTPKVAISGVDFGEEAPSSEEDEKDNNEGASQAQTVEEEKKEKRVAEVQPMMGNQLLFKELAAAAAARPPPRSETPPGEPVKKPNAETEEGHLEDAMERKTHQERSHPVAEKEDHHADIVDSQKDHKAKHKLLGIKLPRIAFGSKRKSQDFLNLDVAGGETSGKENSPVLTSERIIPDKVEHFDNNDSEDGVVPLGSKEKISADAHVDNASVDEAVVPFSVKVASDSGSTDDRPPTPALSLSDEKLDLAGTSQPSSGAVSPAEYKDRNVNLGSQDSLDGLGSAGEETDLPENKSFSALDWMQKSVNEWDTRQVGMLMVGMGLDQYVDAFHNKGVNGPEFITLNGSKLKDLGVANADHRAVIKKKVKELKALEKEKNKLKDQKKDGKGKDGRLSKGFWKGKYTLH